MKYIILIILLSACSTANLLKRADRLIKKAEAKGAHWSNDTIKTMIPVFIKEIHTDTVVNSVTGDTVYINKENIRIKFVKLPGDSVFIDVKVPADTVYEEVTTVVNRTIEAKYPWNLVIGMGISILVLLLFLFFLLKSSKN